MNGQTHQQLHPGRLDCLMRQRFQRFISAFG
jgi:hypothetical protein